MALSAFDDKSKKPTAADIQEVLGRAGAHWTGLISHVASEFPPVEEQWSYSGEKYGWSLRLKRKKRVILYMTPCERHFLVGFVLGDKAVKAARDAGVPEAVVATIDNAPRYGEGTGFRVEVRSRADLTAVKKLAAVKMAN